MAFANGYEVGSKTGWGHLTLVMALIAAFVAIGSPAARAMPPDNDMVDGVVIIGELPFATTQDTTEATTDDLDAALNEECGAPATEASVWYQLSSAEDLGVSVYVGDSSYSAGVIVTELVDGEQHVVTCGPFEVLFPAGAGNTYRLLVFDDTPGGTNGGLLDLQVTGFPIGPPPEVTLTVDPVGSFFKDGTARVSGTFTCTGEAEFIELFGEVRQRVGRFSINGFFGVFDEGENGGALACDGATHPWSADVFSDNGLFKGGSATVDVGVFACGFFTCSEDQIAETIKLRRAG